MKFLKILIKAFLKFFNVGIHPIDNSTAYILGSYKKVKSYSTFFKRLLVRNYTPTNDEAIKELLKKENPTIFDVGANVGDSISTINNNFPKESCGANLIGRFRIIVLKRTEVRYVFLCWEIVRQNTNVLYKH